MAPGRDGAFSSVHGVGSPVPLPIHQPSHSLLNHGIERSLLDTLQVEGTGRIVFGPLAQMAVAWVLRHPGMSSALIGASKPEQTTELVGALQNLPFSAEELAAIDRHAVDGGIKLWQKPLTDQRV